MNRKGTILILAVLCTALLGCPQSISRTDGGGVLFYTASFNGVPVTVSVNNAMDTNGGLVQIGTINLALIVKNPNAGASSLMTVNVESYEVTFNRADTGTRTPPKLVRAIFGAVNAGGTLTFNNLPIMTTNQLQHQPLRDLLVDGYDTETNSEVIVLNVSIRFFGRTLSGDAVETAPVQLTIDFTR